MPVNLDALEIVTRLGAAMLCGGILGWERETQRKPAGLRTMMLVSVGAAAFTLVAAELAVVPGSGSEPDELMRVDQLRVVAGVITGIGFLGAGTILQSSRTVTGMTTAATVWVMGSLGTACGLGYYKIAALTAVTGFVILAGVGWLEERFLRRGHSEED